MNEPERLAELERRIAELERQLHEPPMARMARTLFTPEARTHLRELGSQQLLLMAEVSRGLAELLSPGPTKPDAASDARPSRQVPID